MIVSCSIACEKETKELRKKIVQLREQREQMLTELDALQDALDRGELDAQGQQRLERLAKQLDNYGQQLQRLAKAMRARAEQQQLYELEKPYTDMLKSLADQLEQQAYAAQNMNQAISRMSNPSAPLARSEFDEALQQLHHETSPFDEQNQQRIEQNVEIMESLRKADALLAGADRIRAEIHRQ